MLPSFEQRRDRVHEGILSGEIGCPFAKIAALRNEIAYCASPDNIDAGKISQHYINGIAEFALDQTKSVLIALPETRDPRSNEECLRYAQQLFPETVSSMRFATRDMLDLILTDVCDGDDDLYPLLEMNPMQMRKTIFDFWKTHADKLSNFPATSGVQAPSLLRSKTRKDEPMYTFVTDPSYQPLRDIPHPRFSPHFAMIINYRNDLLSMTTNIPAQLSATRKWMTAAVGYPYSQGYRITQEPLVVNDES